MQDMGLKLFRKLQKELWPAYNRLLLSLADDDLMAVQDAMLDTLKAASIPQSLPSLLLLDKEYIISAFLQNLSEDTYDAMNMWGRIALDEYRLATLDHDLAITGDAGISVLFRKIVNESKSRFENKVGSLFIVTERLSATELESLSLDYDMVNDDSRKLGAFYAIYEANMDACCESDILSSNTISEPMFLDPSALAPTDVLERHATGEYADRHLFIVTTWPATGNLPEMTGIVTFGIKVDSSSDGSRIDLRQHLFKLKNTLLTLAWVLQVSSFAFQVYTLSQASGDEPKRLREELSREGWLRLLKNPAFDNASITSTSEYKRLFEKLLGLKSNIVIRGVLRDIAEFWRKEDPRMVKLIIAILQQFIDGQGDHKCELVCSTLRHIKAVYPAIRNNESAEILEIKFEIWNKINGLLIEQQDDEIFELAMSALEDLYRVSEAGLQQRIVIALISIIDKLRDTRISHERILVSIILLHKYLANYNNEQPLVTLFSSIVSKLPTDVELPIVYRLFALMSKQQRITILTAMSNLSLEAYDIYHQFMFVDDYLTEGETKQHNERENQRPLSTEIITVYSHKGGVGKTTIALEIAASLKDKFKVCMIELDFIGPTLAYLFKPTLDTNGFISLNELLLSGQVGTLTECDRMELFSGKPQMERRIDRLAAESLDDLCVQGRLVTRSENTEVPDIIACSLDLQLQDLMLPLITSSRGLGIIRAQMDKLLKILDKQGYDYVIIDTPAEFKEVTMVASAITLLYNGRNIFVTTLFSPSFEPLINNLSLDYSTGRNYLVFNKVRGLERQYVKNKTAVVDYFGQFRDIGRSNLSSNSLSETALDTLLCVEKSVYVPWDENRSHFLTNSIPSSSRSKMNTSLNDTNDYLREILEVNESR